MKFADLTWEEINKCINDGAIAILPLGCTEQQGPHLTVDWDNTFITELCLQSSKLAKEKFNIESLVLPTIPVGPTSEHFAWPGYLSISEKTHQKMVYEILRGLVKQGFRKIIVWSGCGGHNLEPIVEKFNRENKESKIYLPHLNYHALACKSGGEKIAEDGGHADAVATSWCLYLAPGMVRKNRIAEANNKPVDWTKPIKNFKVYTNNGALGDITLANIKFGRESWKALIEEATTIIKEISHEKQE